MARRAKTAQAGGTGKMGGALGRAQMTANQFVRAHGVSINFAFKSGMPDFRGSADFRGF